MSKSKLATFILNGLKAVNEITDNIDFKKTTKEHIEHQLPNNIDDKILEIKNSENVEEDFFNFLKKNEKSLYSVEVYVIVPSGKQTLKDHIDYYFRNVQKKYKEDKMFYFYFQLVLMEKFLNQMNKKIPRSDLKNSLRDILKNQCLREKKVMSKCLGSMNDDSVEVISEFGNKVNNACKLEREKLEGCILDNFSRR